MKKTVLWITVPALFAALLTVTACGSSKKRNINGKPVSFRLVKENINREEYGRKGMSVEFLEDAILLSEKDIAEVYAADDPTGRPAMMMKLTAAGTAKFAEVTGKNINRDLAIVFEGKIILSARIMMEITGGELQVSGSFTQKEIDDMVRKIRGD